MKAGERDTRGPKPFHWLYRWPVTHGHSPTVHVAPSPPGPTDPPRLPRASHSTLLRSVSGATLLLRPLDSAQGHEPRGNSPPTLTAPRHPAVPWTTMLCLASSSSSPSVPPRPSHPAAVRPGPGIPVSRDLFCSILLTFSALLSHDEVLDGSDATMLTGRLQGGGGGGNVRLSVVPMPSSLRGSWPRKVNLLAGIR